MLTVYKVKHLQTHASSPSRKLHKVTQTFAKKEKRNLEVNNIK